MLLFSEFATTSPSLLFSVLLLFSAFSSLFSIITSVGCSVKFALLFDKPEAKFVLLFDEPEEIFVLLFDKPEDIFALLLDKPEEIFVLLFNKL